MRKKRNKIILAISTCLILAISFLADTALPKNTEEHPPTKEIYVSQPIEVSINDNKSEEKEISESTKEPSIEFPSEEMPLQAENQSDFGPENNDVTVNTPVVTESPAEPDKSYETEPSTVTQQPSETEQTSDNTQIITCSLIVRCDEVLENIELLADGKEEIIPSDGIIYQEQSVVFSEGESVFDVMHRELKKNNIHFEFVKTPMYKSAYIEGIGNLYEFDCGSYSGWQYNVNGIKPTYGCSQNILKNGDKIDFFYSCNYFES